MKRIFVEVVTKDLYCIEKDNYPKDWDIAKILSMWFSEDKINNFNASRDASLVGSSKRLVRTKVLKDASCYEGVK